MLLAIAGWGARFIVVLGSILGPLLSSLIFEATANAAGILRSSKATGVPLRPRPIQQATQTDIPSFTFNLKLFSEEDYDPNSTQMPAYNSHSFEGEGELVRAYRYNRNTFSPQYSTPRKASSMEDNTTSLHYTCPPISLEVLRRRYGKRQSFWGEWSEKQTRQFYKTQLPKALQIDGALNLSLEERAQLASAARHALRSYARERCYLPGRLLARLYDGVRHLVDFGTWSSSGLTWEEVQQKYRRQAVAELGDDACPEEIECYIHKKVVDKACSTNKFIDRIALKEKKRRPTLKTLQPTNLLKFSSLLYSAGNAATATIADTPPTTGTAADTTVDATATDATASILNYNADYSSSIDSSTVDGCGSSGRDRVGNGGTSRVGNLSLRNGKLHSIAAYTSPPSTHHQHNHLHSSSSSSIVDANDYVVLYCNSNSNKGHVLGVNISAAPNPFDDTATAYVTTTHYSSPTTSTTISTVTAATAEAAAAVVESTPLLVAIDEAQVHVDEEDEEDFDNSNNHQALERADSKRTSASITYVGLSLASSVLLTAANSVM